MSFEKKTSDELRVPRTGSGATPFDEQTVDWYVNAANAEIDRLQVELTKAERATAAAIDAMNAARIEKLDDGWINVDVPWKEFVLEPEPEGVYEIEYDSGLRTYAIHYGGTLQQQLLPFRAVRYRRLPLPEPKQPERRYTLPIKNMTAADILELDPAAAQQIIELARELENRGESE